MTPLPMPELNLSVVGPLVWVSIGAMLVLLGEVLLSRVKGMTPHTVNIALAACSRGTFKISYPFPRAL